MKINRVILASDANPLYCDFWNPLSKVWKTKFGIEPTLVWLGNKEDLDKYNISNEFGEICLVFPHPNYLIPFQTTWALFWATQFYPEDTSIIMGIDQVPLSRLFLDMVSEIPENDYAMLISDAYNPHNWTHTASPSSYHVAKGSTYNKVHNFDESFHAEIEKVANSGIKGFWEEGEGRWGVDESYSCHNLRNTDVNIHALNNFSLLCERRIECERHKEPEYDLQKLKDGWYSESHLCRPYSNHKQWIDNLFNNVTDW